MSFNTFQIYFHHRGMRQNPAGPDDLKSVLTEVGTITTESDADFFIYHFGFETQLKAPELLVHLIMNFEFSGQINIDNIWKLAFDNIAV